MKPSRTFFNPVIPKAELKTHLKNSININTYEDAYNNGLCDPIALWIYYWSIGTF